MVKDQVAINVAIENKLRGCDLVRLALTHLRRTKAAEIYRKTRSLRAMQQPLDHAKVDRTVRYLGFELKGAVSVAKRIDI